MESRSNNGQNYKPRLCPCYLQTLWVSRVFCMYFNVTLWVIAGRTYVWCLRSTNKERWNTRWRPDVVEIKSREILRLTTRVQMIIIICNTWKRRVKCGNMTEKGAGNTGDSSGRKPLLESACRAGSTSMGNIWKLPLSGPNPVRWLRYRQNEAGYLLLRIELFQWKTEKMPTRVEPRE